jgi:hypothetical protein
MNPDGCHTCTGIGMDMSVTGAGMDMCVTHVLGFI